MIDVGYYAKVANVFLFHIVSLKNMGFRHRTDNLPRQNEFNLHKIVSVHFCQ